MGKEIERIPFQVDGQPEPTTKENNLRELDEALGKTGDEYVDEVTKEPEIGQGGDESNPEQDGEPEPEGEEEPGEGDQPSDDASAKDGDKSSDSAEPGKPGNSAQPGEPGQSGQPSAEGQSGQGSGQPIDGKNGAPSNSSSQGMQSSAPEDAQQPDDAKGQGQEGHGDSQEPQGLGESGGQGNGQSGDGAMTEGQAKSDVTDALQNLEQEIQNALRGKENGTGLEQGMTSGQNMMEQGAWDKAIGEMAKELGVGGMQGDINIDCDEIPGNPFKSETPEKTQERKRQMLSQATKQDKIHGGNGWGSLPNWAKDEINGILNPPLRLGQKIKKVVGNYGRPDSATFKRSNKRNSFREYTPLLPGKKKNTSRIYILMDTSGSMFNETDLDNLRMAMGLVKRLATSKAMEVLVVQCDAGLQKVMTTKEALAQIMDNKFKVSGGGGSDFTEGFEYIWKEMKEKDALYGAPIIVFTDGGITVPEMPPKNMPRHQTLWITTPGQRAPTDKWGEHLILADLA
jgi:hypothetical protein